MYSRNIRSDSENIMRVPENYGGSFLRRRDFSSHEQFRKEKENEPSTIKNSDPVSDRSTKISSLPVSGTANIKPSGTDSYFLSHNFSNTFPFGHGIGYEELFILGIILALINNNSDSQSILLLIILLFCG